MSLVLRFVFELLVRILQGRLILFEGEYDVVLGLQQLQKEGAVSRVEYLGM